jgi:hypothetical protein
METITVTKLFYNGTGLDLLTDRATLERLAKNAMEEQLKTYTMAEMKAGCLKDLDELERDLLAQFKHTGLNIKMAMKHWGAKSGENYCRWSFGILTLLKLKVIQNDDKNGWWEMTVPTDVFEMMGGSKITKAKKILQTCECCGLVATLKKCGGCRKVYYCGAECQKSHWLTHKATCC